VEQLWNSFFGAIRQLFIAAAQPFVEIAGWMGIEIVAAQAWMIFFTLLFVAYGIFFLHDEFMLARRGRRAVGTVIGIDRGDEAPDQPIIEFRDLSGNPVVFTSHLFVNATTRVVGAKVDIVFDPHHPKRAREVGRTGAKTYHLVHLAVIIAFLVFAAVMARDAIY